MIKEVKLKNTKHKKIANFKNDKNKSNIKYNNNNNTKKTKTKINNKYQNGGNKERFEIVKLADIDYSQFTLSKYVKSDIDWGNSPGRPPDTCSIL
jgi:hypothetical protein